MYQIADNLLSETMYILTVIQFLWNGMDPLLVGMTDRNFSTTALVLQKWSCLHHWSDSGRNTVPLLFIDIYRQTDRQTPADD